MMHFEGTLLMLRALLGNIRLG